jgi:hypothetical protein
MPMMVTMLLADAAQARDGKLYVLGGGWSVTGPEPEPSAIALLIKVPWDQANQRHHLRLELVDSDGGPVSMETPFGEQALVIESDFEVGRPPGMTPGTPIDMPLVIKLGPIPLPPGGRFQWRLTIDNETEDDWHLGFSTRPATPPPPGAPEAGGPG